MWLCPASLLVRATSTKINDGAASGSGLDVPAEVAVGVLQVWSVPLVEHLVHVAEELLRQAHRALAVRVAQMIVDRLFGAVFQDDCHGTKIPTNNTS